MICDEAHTALGEKTSAAIRSFPEPIYIGMTATEQLIAKQVSDVFPASVDDLPLADAARRGLIAPLRCLRVPPAAAINSVPIVGGDFEERALAAALDHQALNQAAASLYRERFDATPGIVYAAGVDHAYNLAQEFRAAGLKAEAVSGRTPPVKLAETLAAYERGEINVLINAMLLAEGWNSPRATVCMHLAPTASKRVYQQRIGRIMRTHPRKEAGIVVDFTPKSATHNERVVSLHSLLDADFYREGARVTPAPRRRVQRRARRRLSPAPWLVPVTPDVSRRLAVIQREWQRIDPKFLDEDEQRFWATIAGRQIRFDQRAEFAKKFVEGRASKAALETFLAVCAAENPNRRLRMTALQDRVAMTVERADFDDLVTLVSQAPPWDKDRAAGARILLRAIGEGKANAPDQILQRWTWRLARATRKVQDRRASAEFPEAKRLLGAVANSRGHRHEENVAKLVQVAKALPLEVGAALLASSEGYTPRANIGARPRPRGARRDAGDRERARRQPARAEGAVAQVAPAQAEEARRRRGAGAAGRRGRRAGAERRGRRRGGEARPKRRRRRRRPPAAEDGACAARGRRNPRVRVAPLPVLAMLDPAGDRLRRGDRHGALAVRAAGAADRARRRRDGTPAARDRRGHRRQLHRLHALRRLAARPARAAAGPAAQPRDRAALPRRADAARAAGRRAGRPAAAGADSAARRAISAAASCSARASGSSSCPCAGPVLAAVTVIAAKREVGLDGVLLTLAYATRRRAADARDRLRRASAPRGCSASAPRRCAARQACSSARRRSRSRSASTRSCRPRSPATPSRCRSGSSARTPRSESSAS